MFHSPFQNRHKLLVSVPTLIMAVKKCFEELATAYVQLFVPDKRDFPIVHRKVLCNAWCNIINCLALDVKLIKKRARSITVADPKSFPFLTVTRIMMWECLVRKCKFRSQLTSIKLIVVAIKCGINYHEHSHSPCWCEIWIFGTE